MSRVARSGLLLLFAAVAFLASCRREAPANIDRNQAPETYIRRAPAESTLTYYRAHFYWSGSDADGQIAYYEIAVTDSNESPGDHVEEGTGYTRTLATDSVFVLAAGRPIEQQISGKRLYVRAVDNEGKLDPTPALAFFQAKNVFNHANSPRLEPELDQLIVDLYSMTLEQQNYLWGTLGGKYLPSVAYQLRLILLQDKQLMASGLPILEVNIDGRQLEPSS